MRPISPLIFASIGLLLGVSSHLHAQQDSLKLSTLYQDALRSDPRARQFDLHTYQTRLRLRNVDADRLPAFALQGQGQYQSDVTTFPFLSPTGQPLVTPPHDSYDAFLSVQQRVFDPTMSPRRAAERAQLAESQARVKTSLFGLRQEVNESFFTAVLLQERLREVDAIILELEARLKETEARVQEGVALPGDVASIKAVILQRRQDQIELRTTRRAALKVLSELVGREITEETPLALPNVSAADVTHALNNLATLRARPEYDQFASARERLARQAALVTAQERPRVSAFGRAGYGRPGLNMMNDKFDTYWLAGLQVQWAPWNWGSGNREREAIAIQQKVVEADEAAFTETLQRAIQRDIATIERLDSVLVLDDEIVSLREQVDKEAQIRFQEGVITAADYLDRNTDVLQARLARTAHRVERAQSYVRILTTLGLEIK
jgi:outer membrane protein TolC